MGKAIMMAVDIIGAGSTATMFRPQGREEPRGSVASYHSEVRNGARPKALTIAMAGVPLESRPPLIRHVERELNRLWALPLHWDGRHAAQLTLAAAQGAVNMLGALLSPDGPPPQFFPLPDGGVQVEWLIADNSIEIEIEGDGSVQILAMNAAGELIAEGELTDPDSPEVVARARRFLEELAEIWRLGAPQAA
jgi:hypothetical protein